MALCRVIVVLPEDAMELAGGALTDSIKSWSNQFSYPLHKIEYKNLVE